MGGCRGGGGAKPVWRIRRRENIDDDDDIYLTQLGFHPVAVVGILVQRYERCSCVQKEKQYTKQYKITEYTKHKTNIQNKRQT
jgi:hypothetical protein